MVATFDIEPDRVLLTDATTGASYGIRLNNNLLSVVTGGLTIQKVLNNMTTGLLAALPASSQFGLWYYASDTEQLFFDTGTRWALISGLSNDSACRVYLSAANQSVPSGAVTKIEYDGEIYDESNEFDSAVNHRFTATRAGKYLIMSQNTILDLTDGKLFILYIKVNGVSVIDKYATGSGAATLAGFVSIICDLAANDFVEVYVYHNHGANRDIEAFSTRSCLIVHKLA